MQLGIQLGTAHATHSSGGGRGKMQIEREPPGQDDLAVKHLDGAGWGNAQLSKDILGAFFQVGINAGIDGGGVSHNDHTPFLQYNADCLQMQSVASQNKCGVLR